MVICKKKKLKIQIFIIKKKKFFILSPSYQKFNSQKIRQLFSISRSLILFVNVDKCFKSESIPWEFYNFFPSSLLFTLSHHATQQNASWLSLHTFIELIIFQQGKQIQTFIMTISIAFFSQKKAKSVTRLTTSFNIILLKIYRTHHYEMRFTTKQQQKNIM